MEGRLTKLSSGMEIPYGGNRVAVVDDALASAFVEGDRLVIVQDTGALLHVPSADHLASEVAVDAASSAFARLGQVTDSQITDFYLGFAAALEDPDTIDQITAANEADVVRAKEHGRSTTRLVLSDKMLADMIDGLRMWSRLEAGRGTVVDQVQHDGWHLDQVRSGLGVVGFVFEGRPNVLADATGVLRSGNAVVFRIGSDALGTARSIMSNAVEPALAAASLPAGTVSLVDSASRASGWALFSDPRLGLAVARGSGGAVSQLGSVARQAGTPVSLHGTGGAWIVASSSARADDMAAAVYHSLDRKVCNTLNTMCIVSERADDLVPAFLEALDRSADRLGTTAKLHVTDTAGKFVPERWFDEVEVDRADGPNREPKTEPIEADQLGVEWEWEQSPEVTLTLVSSVEEAVELFNTQSPRFAASLISTDDTEHQSFFDAVDAPFVGNGFTRWVDGQYALERPELGLSNWQFGRLFGRGGVLSGDSVYTVRARVTQTDPDIGR